MALITITMTDAQRSAIECSGILEDDSELYFPGLIDGRKMMFCEEARERVCEILTDLCNSEDALAFEGADKVMQGFARRACTALCNLGTKAQHAAA